MKQGVKKKGRRRGEGGGRERKEERTVAHFALDRPTTPSLGRVISDEPAFRVRSAVPSRNRTFSFKRGQLDRYRENKRTGLI